MAKDYTDLTPDELAAVVQEIRIGQSLNDTAPKSVSLSGGTFNYKDGVIDLKGLDPYTNQGHEAYTIDFKDLSVYHAVRHKSAIYDGVYDSNYNEVPSGFSYNFQFTFTQKDGFTIDYSTTNDDLAKKIIGKLNDKGIKGRAEEKVHL